MKKAPSILGTGLAFPFQEGGNGPAVVSEEVLVKASISQILGTRVGERPFCVRSGRLFGVRIADGLFESMVTAKDIIPYEVAEALAIWEPRIFVNSVTAVELSPDAVAARVEYRLRSTNRADNFVKPYRIRRA